MEKTPSRRSDALDDRGRAHAAADAEGDERRALAGPFKLVERGAEDHCAGRAKRMAHRDRAAIDIDPALVEVERLAKAQHDRSERLVDLEQIDVAQSHAGARELFSRPVDRAV